MTKTRSRVRKSLYFHALPGWPKLLYSQLAERPVCQALPRPTCFFNGLDAMTNPSARSHRVSCLRLTLVLLAIWFFVSLGCSILFRNWMDANMPQVGNAPFGFWMAQQGSIICFVILLIVYAILMHRLDTRHGYTE